MHSDKYRLIAAIFAVVLFLVSAAYSNEISNGDIPEIFLDACDTLCQFKYVDVDTCWPGDTAYTPIYVLNKAELTKMEFTVDCPSGYTFEGLNTEGTPWSETAIFIDTISEVIYIEFSDSSSDTLDYSSTYRRLVDVKLKASVTLDFGTVRTVDFEEPPRARVAGSGDDCIVDSAFSGQITIPNDSVVVIIGPQTVYSFQGSATDDSFKADFPVTMPISLYTNFPCSTYSLIFDRQLATWSDRIPVGFDTVYEAGCTYTPLFYGYYVKLSGTPTQNMGNDHILHLGDLKLQASNFASSYNSDSSFSDTFYVSLKESYSSNYTFVYNWGDDDSIPFDSIHSNSAEMIFPQYSVEFKAQDANVDTSGKVVVPVTLNPTFYAADYSILINYDFDFMTLDSVVSAGGLAPEIDTALLTTDYQARRNHYRIESDSLFQEGKYFLPDSEQTAFYLYFSIEDTFAVSNSTTIEFTPGGDTVFVYDWFSLNNSTYKIRRDGTDSVFWNTTNGSISRPERFYVSVGGPTYYGNEIVRLEIYVDYINVDSVTACELEYSEETTEPDSVWPGDWEFENLDYNPQILDMYFGNEQGEHVDAVGLLAYLWVTWSDTGRFEILDDDASWAYYPGGFIEVQFVGDPIDYKWRQPKLATGLPDEFSLSQNYPNPFNSRTNIRFEMGRPGFAELKIYDLLGRRIKTIVSRELPAGKHMINWDGTNGEGKSISSGIYFYVLEAGDFREARRMVYLK